MPDPGRSRADRNFLFLFFLGILGFYGVFAYTNYIGAEGLHDNEGILLGRDFVVFWSASVLALAGQASQIFDVEVFHRMQEKLIGGVVPLYPWIYPPHALFYILPLGLLPFLWSYVIWSLTTWALYLWAALGRSWKSLRGLALVLAPASFVNVVMGQNGFLSTALLVGGLRLLDSRPVLAGVLLGLLCFKPQLGLLIPVALIAARLWRPFVSATATVMAVLALSLGIFGVDAWTSFFEMSTIHQARLLSDDRGWFLNIVATPYMGAGLLGFGMTARGVIQALFSLGAILGVYVSFRNGTDRNLRIAVLLAAVLLATPYGYYYDLTLVSVAVLFAFEHATRAGFRPGERILLAVAWLLPLFVVAGNARGIPVAPPVLAVLFAVLLIRTNGWSLQLGGVRRASAP